MGSQWAPPTFPDPRRCSVDPESKPDCQNGQAAPILCNCRWERTAEGKRGMASAPSSAHSSQTQRTADDVLVLGDRSSGLQFQPAAFDSHKVSGGTRGLPSLCATGTASRVERMQTRRHVVENPQFENLACFLGFFVVGNGNSPACGLQEGRRIGAIPANNVAKWQGNRHF